MFKIFSLNKDACESSCEYVQMCVGIFSFELYRVEFDYYKLK